MDDEIVSLDFMLQRLKEQGNRIEVYRNRRGHLGFLGVFSSVKQCDGKFDYATRTYGPPNPSFWKVNYVMQGGVGSEIVIKSTYNRLEIKKVEPRLFHLVIPE